MNENECERLRLRIIRRCKKRDAEYWNGLPHNQQYEPLDVEWFRVTRHRMQETLASAEKAGPPVG